MNKPQRSASTSVVGFDDFETNPVGTLDRLKRYEKALEPFVAAAHFGKAAQVLTRGDWLKLAKLAES